MHNKCTNIHTTHNKHVLAENITHAHTYTLLLLLVMHLHARLHTINLHGVEGVGASCQKAIIIAYVQIRSAYVTWGESLC